MAVTIDELATKVNLNKGSVSRILNGKGDGFADHTKLRVRQAAAEMGYRPNSFARNIARGRTNTLRLICSSHNNPFFVEVTNAVDNYTRKAGYKLWVDATLHDRMHYAPGEEVGIWPVDGVLIWSIGKQDLTDLLGSSAETIPVVYLGFQDEVPIDAVTFDQYEGGRTVAELLVARGYRKIAYLALETHRLASYFDSRIRAYEDVCRAAGLPIKHLNIPDQRIEADRKLCFETGREVAAMPVHDRPDAVMCLGDAFAIAFCNGVRRAGLRVPEDIAVVGYDGVDEGQYLDVQLTTVSIPLDSICKAGIDLLLRRIQGDRNTPPQRLVFPTKLILGDTT